MHYFVAIILKRRKLVALLSYRCVVAMDVLWLFLMVLWVGLQCVIVVFPDHAYLLFGITRVNHLLADESHEISSQLLFNPLYSGNL